MFDTIEKVVAGDDVAGITVFDLEAGGVGYSTSGDFMDQATIDQLEELKASDHRRLDRGPDRAVGTAARSDRVTARR